MQQKNRKSSKVELKREPKTIKKHITNRFEKKVGKLWSGPLQPGRPSAPVRLLNRILQNPDFQTEATTCGCPKCDWEVYFANGQYNTSGFQSRADQKALEKEIPWHLIPHEQRDGYHQAYLRECASWVKFGAARGATDAEQAAGEKGDHDLAEMRVCYRNKNAGIKDANVEEKARVVIRGYKCDNIVSADGTAMKRETPTLSHLGHYVDKLGGYHKTLICTLNPPSASP